MPQQLSLPKHAGWGGRRKGAGRKPNGSRSGVSHSARPILARRFPVHVTLRVLSHVWNLRSRRGLLVVRRALAHGADRLGMRICEFSVQGNHVHIIAEADDMRSLSRGMQGFAHSSGQGPQRDDAARGQGHGRSIPCARPPNAHRGVPCFSLRASQPARAPSEMGQTRRHVFPRQQNDSPAVRNGAPEVPRSLLVRGPQPRCPVAEAPHLPALVRTDRGGLIAA
jgi:hypothetical protein